MVFVYGNFWLVLEFWFVLCEWYLGLGVVLDCRLVGLGGSSDFVLVDFVVGMCV